MDPVSNADRLVRILRQRLQERSRAGNRGAAGGQAESASRGSGLQALAAVAGVDDRHMRRSLVQSILTDQFGNAMINDAKFQAVVDQVTETLEQDPQGARLLNRMVAELRAAAR